MTNEAAVLNSPKHTIVTRIKNNSSHLLNCCDLFEHGRVCIMLLSHSIKCLVLYFLIQEHNRFENIDELKKIPEHDRNLLGE